ncbi:MAG: hypothetical protein RLZZ501_1485 [Pseudomonadota bacterium]
MPATIDRAATGPAPIEFWFDFNSPYAFFASREIETVAERHGRAVLWRPFLLGVAFKATGMQGLTTTPLRGDYARHDWDRQGRRLGVRFRLPPGHPFSALAPSRLFYWLEGRDPAVAARFAKRCLDAAFIEGIALTDAETTVATAGAIVPYPAETLIAAAAEPAVKQRLKDRTDEALRRGIFGSPFMIADGEPFWGADRLAMLDEWLGCGGW